MWLGRFSTRREKEKAVRDWWAQHERERDVESVTVADYAERFLLRYERALRGRAS